MSTPNTTLSRNNVACKFFWYPAKPVATRRFCPIIPKPVVYCVPDNTPSSVNGFVTFVISDPSDDVLARWGATWMPWGAMEPADVTYDINLNPLTNADGVYYYGFVLYRQTIAAASFAQSIENVARLPASQRRAAMGDYWPSIGYCTLDRFTAVGAACVIHR